MTLSWILRRDLGGSGLLWRGAPDSAFLRVEGDESSGAEGWAPTTAGVTGAESVAGRQRAAQSRLTQGPGGDGVAARGSGLGAVQTSRL